MAGSSIFDVFSKLIKQLILHTTWIAELTRQSASKLQKGQQIVLTAEITNPFQTITCTVMCDEIGKPP